MTTAAVGEVEFDLSRYPVVILRMPARGSVASIEAWYERVERLLVEAVDSIALVHDLRPVELGGMTAEHRRAVAEGTKRLERSPHSRKIAADARIFSNAVMAGAVTAVSWITGSTPWPQANFSNDRDAIVWSSEQLGIRAVV